jgi:hypothetical protein
MAVAAENELAYSRLDRGAALFEQAASSPQPPRRTQRQRSGTSTPAAVATTR